MDNLKKSKWRNLTRLIDALGVYVEHLVNVGVLGKDFSLNGKNVKKKRLVIVLRAFEYCEYRQRDCTPSLLSYYAS